MNSNFINALRAKAAISLVHIESEQDTRRVEFLDLIAHFRDAAAAHDFQNDDANQELLEAVQGLWSYDDEIKRQSTPPEAQRSIEAIAMALQAETDAERGQVLFSMHTRHLGASIYVSKMLYLKALCGNRPKRALKQLEELFTSFDLDVAAPGVRDFVELFQRSRPEARKEFYQLDSKRSGQIRITGGPACLHAGKVLSFTLTPTAEKRQ